MYHTTPLRRFFNPPTDHYCEDLFPLDEQICALLAKRKELSGSNPGFPKLELISTWSEKYGLNEDWLRSVFAVCSRGEEVYTPLVEPNGFLKFVPILKRVEIDNMIYAVTYMKQYSNASVVYVETEVNTTEPYVRLGHAQFELYISSEYHCRQSSGCGSCKGMQHSFVVTPSLPDDVSEVEFRLSVKPFPKDPVIQEMSYKEHTVKIR